MGRPAAFRVLILTRRAVSPSGCCYTFALHVVRRSHAREVQDSICARQRRVRNRVSRRRHLDQKEGCAQGPAPAEPELQRTAARAPSAGHARPSQHRLDLDGGEAGQRLLHRHGIRPGRDPRERHRDRRPTRDRSRDRVRDPDRARGRACARPRRHPPGSPTGQRAGVRVGDLEGRRLRDLALSRDRGPRHDDHRQSTLHGAGAVPRRGGLCVRPVLGRCHHLPDGDRCPALRHTLARRSREAAAGRAGATPAVAEQRHP